MTDIIYLAAGCFWGAQRYFDLLNGVVQTTVGYANGRTASPTYEQVKHCHTGHVETVRVEYDPEKISLAEILGLYFRIIDPVSLNRQGEDEGEQYRTGIYYTSESQKAAAEISLADLQKKYPEPLAIECLPLKSFYPAEEYHQKYLEKNPGGYCHVSKAMMEYAMQFNRGHS